MERFWSKVHKTDSCWEWTGSLDRAGYGRFGFRSTNWKASRVSWTLTFGEIPAGIHVCHKCDNPKCVRPEHLFLGDYQANMDDMNSKGRNGHKAKTHCPRGHEYSGENLWISKAGGRTCLICAKVRSDKSQLKPEVRERALEYNRAYHAANAEKIRERKRLAYRLKHLTIGK